MHTEPAFRFAPSPNGELHLGHAYSVLVNRGMAREAGGRFLLRIEDIDQARCTREYERQIAEDLIFLGVDWDAAPRRQSEHFADYAAALEALCDAELIYPGFMSRGEIRTFAHRYEADEGEAWPRDPDGAPLYPALDRDLSSRRREQKMRDGERFAWRLNTAKAVASLGTLTFEETGLAADEGGGEVVARPLEWGDVVLGRMETPTSYHLSVVVDDALQGITHVVRGRDLFPATSIHRLLQALLGLPVPRYHHHELILGPDGRKLSKSAGDTAIRALREAGLGAEDIRRMVGLPQGPAARSVSRGSSARR
ncbi:tRNA glutamyl-Q(34) synthetase GluQRS [Aurantimonas sp. A2-1-M11]|uniref:tRNA glutamyl-Q(34) synthetase GluQRS n=1 Tax=Aurantimonas sp. A2-1-M11 TaxID=3113712 RepID=UPI002F91EF89